MLAFPNCKINLGLYITERRSDKFHNLLTCFYPVLWNDILEIVPQQEFEFVQTGLQVPGKPEDNLCVKAYRLLKKDFNLPNARIHLHKIIPMGAGLGGGSSDAAFVLKTLNETFELNIEQTQLENYATKLGSDCAFFIRNRPVIALGRGEVMQDISLDLKETHILIIYPALHVSTADAFGGVKPRPFDGDFAHLLNDRARWKNDLHNQFEETIFPKYPQLEELKQELYGMGAWYVAMSGSGSAIFGLFQNEPPKNHSQFQTYRGIL
jgi:4-diphosphocytidyl-2-C-methyl-D-erythritol kinase